MSNIRTIRYGGFYEIVGSISRLRNKRVAVFEIDGVLVDSSERYRRALQDIGGREERLEYDKKLKKKFWKLYMSPKYIELDKPVARAIELLKEARKKYAVVLITERTNEILHETLHQLEDYGVTYDLLVFRDKRNNARGAKYKTMAIAFLGLMNLIAEIHDSSKEVVAEFMDSVRDALYYWYQPGKYVLVPSTSIWVDWGHARIPVSLDRLRRALPRDTNLYTKKDMVVEWLGYRYMARDTLDVISALYYISSIASDIVHEERFIRGLDLESIDANTGKLVIHGAEHPFISNGIDRVNLDELLGEPKNFWKHAYRYMIQEGAERLAKERYPSTTNHWVLSDTRDFYAETLRTACHVRLHYDEPENPPELPEKIQPKDIEKYRDKLVEAAIYTGYNLGENMLVTMPVEDEKYKYTVITVHQGAVWLSRPVNIPPIPNLSSLKSIVLVNKYVSKIESMEEELKQFLREMAKKYRLPVNRCYIVIRSNLMYVFMKIFQP